MFQRIGLIGFRARVQSLGVWVLGFVVLAFWSQGLESGIRELQGRWLRVLSFFVVFVLLWLLKVSVVCFGGRSLNELHVSVQY